MIKTCALLFEYKRALRDAEKAISLEPSWPKGDILVRFILGITLGVFKICVFKVTLEKAELYSV